MFLSCTFLQAGSLGRPNNDFQSILLVVCDTPFNVHSYNIVDMGGNAERPHFYLDHVRDYAVGVHYLSRRTVERKEAQSKVGLFH